MIASTPSSRPISVRFFDVFLYCMTEVREITLSARTWARLEISCSVMPSEKYSSLASPERLSNGRTAIDRMVGEATALSRPVARHQNPATAMSATAATPAKSQPRRGRGAALSAVVDAIPVFRPTRRRSTTKSRID